MTIGRLALPPACATASCGIAQSSDRMTTTATYSQRRSSCRRSALIAVAPVRPQSAEQLGKRRRRRIERRIAGEVGLRLHRVQGRDAVRRDAEHQPLAALAVADLDGDDALAR